MIMHIGQWLSITTCGRNSYGPLIICPESPYAERDSTTQRGHEYVEFCPEGWDAVYVVL